MLTCLFYSLASYSASDIGNRFDSLFASAPIVSDSVRFVDVPYFDIPAGASLVYDSLSLENNSSIRISGRLEVGELTVEAGSISSIVSSGSCYVSGNLYLRKNATLAIEGHVEVLGNVISEENAGLIMHAGSLLQVGGNMEGSVSSNIIGGGRVRVKGFVSGGYMDNPNVNKIWPYELIHFSAVNTGQAIELRWATMSEFICKEFVIQRSGDGLLFEDCFAMEALGTANSVQYYSVIDPSPFSGMNYYRLKQINIAGHTISSDVVTSYIDSQLAMLQIVPKPSIQQVDIYYPESFSQISIQLQDRSGNVLSSDIEYSYPYFIIKTSEIVTGIYYVSVEIDGVPELRPVSILN